MTELLKKAFQKASKLTPVNQNVLAKWLLEELKTEKKWGKLFSGSENILNLLADEALQAHKKKKTKPLDIGRL
jgi:hypothetical protein